jgi:hypothetical protein
MRKSFNHMLAFTTFYTGILVNAYALTIQDNEHAFLKKYSGQSKEFVTQNLGKPNKVDIAVKPSNVDEVLKEHQVDTAQAKKEIIEMWYYDAKISYAENKFFNQAELTFVNNKCVNITLANKKSK